MISRVRRLFGRLRELLNVPDRLRAESQRLGRDAHADARDIQLALKEQTTRLEDVRARSAAHHAELGRESGNVHAEVHDRLLQ